MGVLLTIPVAVGGIQRPRDANLQSELAVELRWAAMTSAPADRPLSSAGSLRRPQEFRRPAVLIFDVNETLSDMSPMRGRFEDVGAPAHLATTWFAGLLRDGFALTAAGSSTPFARIAADALWVSLDDVPLNRAADDAVQHIMDGFAGLPVHPDVPEGIRAMHASGVRMVTLSNGSTSVAQALFDRAGIASNFEARRPRWRTPGPGNPPPWRTATRWSDGPAPERCAGSWPARPLISPAPPGGPTDRVD